MGPRIKHDVLMVGEALLDDHILSIERAKLVASRPISQSV
jgi:hypothetical protein